MKYRIFTEDEISEIKKKRIAITGSTGGLGKEICSYLCELGASLILVDRNEKLSVEHKISLEERFAGAKVSCIQCDLEDVKSADKVIKQLIDLDIDIFIHNAGAYKIPRHVCSTGYENIYQINFATPYYMIKKLLPTLRKNKGRVVAVGSVAHTYSKINEDDIDFVKVEVCSKVYGNAKRYLMFGLFELFKNEKEASLCIAHPGITFTNITAHYPPLIFAIIKHPMKVIFMKPKKAALSIIKGVAEKCEYLEWIGPRIFDVWGMPGKKVLHTVSDSEIAKIAEISEIVYDHIDKMEK